RRIEKGKTRKEKERTMHSKRTSAKLFVAVLLTAMFVATAAIWNSTRVKAFNPQPDPPAVLFGITRDQTARLNVANVNGNSTAPIVVQFNFSDAGGQVLAQSVQSIEGGHAMSFDLDGAAVIPMEIGRIELVGQVKFLVAPSNPDRNTPGIMPTIEVIDNLTAKTSWALGLSQHNQTLVRDDGRQRSRKHLKRSISTR